MRRGGCASPSTVAVKGMTMFSKSTLMASVAAFALGLGAGWMVFADAATCWEVQAALPEGQLDSSNPRAWSGRRKAPVLGSRPSYVGDGTDGCAAGVVFREPPRERSAG